jgi:hypothetical protein
MFKEKLPKHALMFSAVVAILVGPWTLYSRAHVPTAEQRVEQSGGIVLPYTAQLWQRTAGRPLSGAISAKDLPERVWNNLSEIGKVDFGAFVFYSFYRTLEPGEQKHIPDRALAVSLLFAFVALAGYLVAVRERLSLAEFVVPLAMSVSLVWGWEQYRLLLPLVPFFLFYLLLGVRSIARLGRKLFGGRPGARGEVAPLLFVSWIFVVGALDGNYRYILRKYDPVPGNRSRWISAFDENEAFIRTVGDLVPKDEPIATDNPALLHLYTGHKTIASTNPAARWRVWERLGVRYYARISSDLVEPDPNEDKYRTIHRSDGILELRLLDLGPPSSRPTWGQE